MDGSRVLEARCIIEGLVILLWPASERSDSFRGSRRRRRASLNGRDRVTGAGEKASAFSTNSGLRVLFNLLGTRNAVKRLDMNWLEWFISPEPSPESAKWSLYCSS